MLPFKNSFFFQFHSFGDSSSKNFYRKKSENTNKNLDQRLNLLIIPPIQRTDERYHSNMQNGNGKCLIQSSKSFISSSFSEFSHTFRNHSRGTYGTEHLFKILHLMCSEYTMILPFMWQYGLWTNFFFPHTSKEKCAAAKTARKHTHEREKMENLRSMEVLQMQRNRHNCT